MDSILYDRSLFVFDLIVPIGKNEKEIRFFWLLYVKILDLQIDSLFTSQLKCECERLGWESNVHSRSKTLTEKVWLIEKINHEPKKSLSWLFTYYLSIEEFIYLSKTHLSSPYKS